MNNKIQASHLERRAAVYLRQSTMKQVVEHRESTRRQYALKQRAVELGWGESAVDVLDQDLGVSGTAVEGRTGFKGLAEGVAHGRVGAIFAVEVSRLSRSSADWHRLLELCSLSDTLIIDEYCVYSPGDYNDRLLLGLKGQMSEAEQYWMRLRLAGGRMNKARRGEMFMRPPAGYEWDPDKCGFRMSSDEAVQRAIHMIFARFRLDPSAWAVSRHLREQGVEVPVRDRTTQQLKWGEAHPGRVLRTLKNPIYAGVYVYGRNEESKALVDGRIQRRRHKHLPLEEWKICLKDRHPGYITWEEFMTNRRKLHDNRTAKMDSGASGAPREGQALLQGLALCGQCGRRMAPRYQPVGGSPLSYVCHPQNVGASLKLCWMVPGTGIDEAVTDLFLRVVQAEEIDLGLALVNEVKAQSAEVAEQWQLRRERLEYEARLAERRYKAIDPDNRLVARSLETDWNDKLQALEDLASEYASVCAREKLELTKTDISRVRALSGDLSQVWHAETTSWSDRKNLLRSLVEEVTLSPVESPTRSTRIQILWRTGAVSELNVARPSKWMESATSMEARAAIGALVAKNISDADIVEELNRRGLLTGKRMKWNVPAVRRVRYDDSLHRDSPKSRRAPNRREDGLYSVQGVAALLDVSPSVVRSWLRRGLLHASDGGGGPGRPFWFQLDDEVLARLKAAIPAGYHRPSGLVGPQVVPKEVHCD